MNRKTYSIVIVLVVVVIAIVIYALWPKTIPKETIGSLPGESANCLIFQSNDSTKPCYVKSVPSTNSDTVPYPPIDSGINTMGTTSGAIQMPSECSQSTNVFERNDCVTKKASITKNTAFCGLVVGSLAQSACVSESRGVTQSITTTNSNISYEAFLRSIKSSVVSPLPSVVSSPGVFSTSSQAKPDPKFTQEGLIERFKNAPLVLFNVSPYQVSPGDTVTLQGTGFNDANDIHAGGYTFSTSSTDGFTLSFPAPESTGNYDIWVTNSNGSSQVAERVMRLVVTTNPAPLPVITGVTPNPANFNDTITISGTGFSNTNVVSTSLGILENVSSSGGTISLKLSDFSLASQIRDISYMKDRKTAILLYVQSAGGLSKESYSFDVQF